MIATLKTKEPQIVNASSGEKRTVYFILDEICDKGENYLALFRYFFYKDEDQKEGQTFLSWKETRRIITADQANTIAASVDTSGMNKRQRDTAEAVAGAFAILDLDRVLNWNLTKDDWELVAE